MHSMKLRRLDASQLNSVREWGNEDSTILLPYSPTPLLPHFLSFTQIVAINSSRVTEAVPSLPTTTPAA
jgi:hypothetical protein